MTNPAQDMATRIREADTPANRDAEVELSAYARELTITLQTHAARAEQEGTDPIATVVGLAVGAASACWDNLAGAGTFRSSHAAKIVDVVVAELARQQWELEQAEAGR